MLEKTACFPPYLDPDREIENVGVNHAMNWLGHFYSEGIHFPWNYKIACEWY